MSLYPELSPYRTGRLKLTDGHTMYYEESGNPHGKPLLLLHGGPGESVSTTARRSANPATTRIIAFDQRGCGKSTPAGSLKANTTLHVVADIERLRAHLGIARWTVWGASWGSTLALTYAQAHPAAVSGLVLMGIFLGTRPEMEWLFGPNGAARFYPNDYRAMCELVGNPKPQKLAQALLEAVTSADTRYAARVAQQIELYECLACDPNPDRARIAAEARSGREAIRATSLLLHYDVHDNFLAPNQLLANIDSIAHIPLHIVQGALDMVCPPESALALHAAHPDSRLYWVEMCGHRANKAGLKARVAAIRDMLKRVKTA